MMRFQDYMIDVTQGAACEAFAYAKAVPLDKQDWKPLDEGRSVLDQCQEMALCPTWAFDIINGKEFEWNEEIAKAVEEEKQQFKTIEACEAECNRRLAKLFELYKNMPDERLSDSRWLPFDGGRDFPMRELMDYPRWNFNYHLGQIAYIQTLYGDKAMHQSNSASEK
jgi:hypothetical protein